MEVVEIFEERRNGEESYRARVSQARPRWSRCGFGGEAVMSRVMQPRFFGGGVSGRMEESVGGRNQEIDLDGNRTVALGDWKGRCTRQGSVCI